MMPVDTFGCVAATLLPVAMAAHVIASNTSAGSRPSLAPRGGSFHKFHGSGPNSASLSERITLRSLEIETMVL